MQIYCPSDTQELVRDRISNFALRHQYFLKNEIKKEKIKFALEDDPGDSQSLIEPLIKRQTNQINYLAKSYKICCEFYKVDWRFITGLGGEHVQETNMTLDYIYGVPYLPGSAFKGTVRSWVIQEEFDNNEALATQGIADSDSADLREKKNNFLDIFGSQKIAGKVQFLSAYPTDTVKLSRDIMNPHFSNYYTGKEPPTDTQNPIPVNFLTVQASTFRFILVSKEQRLIDITQNWIVKVLRERGLGAKTTSGYGHWTKASIGDTPKALRLDSKFQIPERTRLQRVTPISLDTAFQQFTDSNELPDPQSIDITLLKACAAQLARVATFDDYDFNDFIELHQVEGIHSTLIKPEDGYALISDFGKWIWNSLKTELLSSRILELPRLVYKPGFRKTLKHLPAAELVDVQEELIAYSNQLQASEGDTESVDIADHFHYTADPRSGKIILAEYRKE